MRFFFPSEAIQGVKAVKAVNTSQNIRNTICLELYLDVCKEKAF
jgi:hypothetical protein